MIEEMRLINKPVRHSAVRHALLMVNYWTNSVGQNDSLLESLPAAYLRVIAPAL